MVSENSLYAFIPCKLTESVLRSSMWSVYLNNTFAVLCSYHHSQFPELLNDLKQKLSIQHYFLTPLAPAPAFYAWIYLLYKRKSYMCPFIWYISDMCQDFVLLYGWIFHCLLWRYDVVLCKFENWFVSFSKRAYWHFDWAYTEARDLLEEELTL